MLRITPALLPLHRLPRSNTNEIGGFVVTRPPRRARTAAVALAAAATLLVAGCTTSDEVREDHAENTITAELAAQFDTAIEAALSYSTSTSAIVGIWSESGDYVRSYGDGVTANSQFWGAQATQPVMCALLLELDADGVVSLDREVSEDLPRQVGIEGITYGQLCTAQSGLADYKSGFSDIFVNNPTRDWADRELLSQSLARSPLSWPGLDVHLSDTNAVLLERALSVAAGKSTSELLREHVFKPAGMSATYFPRESPAQQSLPAEGMVGSVYPQASGVAQCEAGVTAVTQLAPSMLAGAGATVTTAHDLKLFYEHYLSGSFGTDSAETVLATMPLQNPKRDENGEPTDEVEIDPNARQWGFGVERIGPLYGMSGSIPGTITASYHDPASGFTVVVALDNSNTGESFARRLAQQLTAIAAEHGSGPEVSWTAADLGASLAASAICQPEEGDSAEEDAAA